MSSPVLRTHGRRARPGRDAARFGLAVAATVAVGASESVVEAAARGVLWALAVIAGVFLFAVWWALPVIRAEMGGAG
jgi:hypothetical protein